MGKAFTQDQLMRAIRDSYVWNQFCEEPEYEAWKAENKEA